MRPCRSAAPSHLLLGELNRRRPRPLSKKTDRPKLSRHLKDNQVSTRARDIQVSIPIGARPKRLASVGVEKQGDMATIYESNSGRLLLVNQTGLNILELCDGERDLDAVHARLAELVGDTVSSAQLADDLRVFVAQLYAKGIIQWANTSSQ